MLNTETLRQIIKEIYKIEDEFIVPITTNWFIPDVKTKSESSIFIGYRIINKRKGSIENKNDSTKIDVIKTSFRLVFIGEDAEKFADEIHFWEDNKDILRIFEKYRIQVNSNHIDAFTYPIRDCNCDLAWIIDLDATSDYKSDLKISKSNRKSLKNPFRTLLPNRSSH